MNQQVPLLSIKVTKPGIELILNALAQLPFAQSAGLIQELEAQANFQLEMLRTAAEKQAELINNPPEQPPQPEEE